jgi:hypothetical protein
MTRRVFEPHVAGCAKLGGTLFRTSVESSASTYPQMADPLLNESRRRAYLDAMQVVHWLPRTELPFAAPSCAWVLEHVEPLPVHVEQAMPAVAVPNANHTVERSKVERPVVERPKVEVPRPGIARPAVAAVPEVAVEPQVAKPAPPRFALQVLRAGTCMVLVELATGQAFQSRDPSYLLLKDMLRAAGLPDAPQILGEPIRWPLLQRGQLDQGPDAACDFVQGFVMAQLEQAPCTCLWLVGLPAIRFAGRANAEDYNCELEVEGLGHAWALPGLELLMDEPERKAAVWQAMRRLIPRWKHRDE